VREEKRAEKTREQVEPISRRALGKNETAGGRGASREGTKWCREKYELTGLNKSEKKAQHKGMTYL